MPITFLGLLPNGMTTAFTLNTVVTSEELLSASPSRVMDRSFPGQLATSQPNRILFVTDSFDSVSDRSRRYLVTLQDLVQEGFSVTLLETDRLPSAQQGSGRASLDKKITCVSAEQSAQLGPLLQHHAHVSDFIWITQPGGLRLILATAPHARGKIIFDPRATVSDNALTSSSYIQREHYTFGTEVSLTRNHLVTLVDQLGAVYSLSWFVELSNMADLVVAEDAHSASQLRTAGVFRVTTTASTVSAILKEASADTHTRTRTSPHIGIDLLTAASGTRAWRAPILPSSTPSHTPGRLVDIIVPIYNAADELQNCLNALLHNTDLPSHLIVVDDYSNDPRIDEILSSLPQQLRGTSIHALTILRLSRNAGFSGAVNLGIAAGTNPYVVLLNSDTLAPPQWLSRLIAPLATDRSIGSVTPLSNAATICSFKPINDYEKSFDRDALLGLDSLFAQHGGTEPITIPTGVGFCLAARRSVYDQIGFLDADLFRKMYGEENDWCVRVIHAGLRNVAATNLFVPHVDGASAKNSNLNRSELLDLNLAKLQLIHPDYDASIRQFMSIDPLQPLRTFMHLLLLRNSARSSVTLYVHNTELGGGSSTYLKQLLRQRCREGEALILNATSEDIFIQRSLEAEQDRLRINDFMHDDRLFQELLSTLNIEEIVVNQLTGSAYDILTDRICQSAVPYTVHLHDFFFACPTITLIGHTGRYCGAETRLSQCSTCLPACFGKSAETSNLSISAWREHSYAFLQNASSIVTVSEHTKSIYRRYFPDLLIQVEEPLVESPSPLRTLNNSTLSLPILNVAVLGAIGKHKGSDLIYEIVEILRNRALPIKLVVCGYTERHSEPYLDRGGFFEVTGRYEASELPGLLARHRIAFTLLPSLWPESFLYTASESMAYGYPVMVSGLTAAAERVAGRDAGWIIENLTASGIILELERLFYNRQEIAEKTANLLHTESMPADSTAPIVLAARHPFKDFLVEL
jgi:GT2 family glycosyltransferase/glycosyltransferase involved in cell wall biosynthesis